MLIFEEECIIVLLKLYFNLSENYERCIQNEQNKKK